MNDTIDSIYKKIRELEDQIEAALNRAEQELHYTIERKKILFEKGVVEFHRRLKNPLIKFIRNADVLHIVTAPVIYSLIVPFAFLDLMATMYQWICFPVYGIKKVPREDFIVLDHHHLAYLNIIEKLNCVYCGYANGVAGYVREIGARTERYWCPIKHAKRIHEPHAYYHDFVKYGDAEQYRRRLRKIEKELNGREKPGGAG
ncbi:MAG: hypothetical protein HZB29_05380 [Nitrospinae bacterium]|nr:hypothetical protein [Nitrospinota bacterium]